MDVGRCLRVLTLEHQRPCSYSESFPLITYIVPRLMFVVKSNLVIVGHFVGIKPFETFPLTCANMSFIWKKYQANGPSTNNKMSTMLTGIKAFPNKLTLNEPAIKQVTYSGIDLVNYALSVQYSAFQKCVINV